jgi:hypothetical protein
MRVTLSKASVRKAYAPQACQVAANVDVCYLKLLCEAGECGQTIRFVAQLQLRKPRDDILPLAEYALWWCFAVIEVTVYLLSSRFHDFMTVQRIRIGRLCLRHTITISDAV